MKVIRIVQYEGTEEAVRAAIQKCMPVGVRKCVDYELTIAEHLNELTQPILLPDTTVTQLIKMQKLISLIED